jgi:HD superfamily phosphohydrolase YqeK
MRGMVYVCAGRSFEFRRSGDIEGDCQLDLVDAVIWIADTITPDRVWPVMVDARSRLDRLVGRQAQTRSAAASVAIDPTSDADPSTHPQ